MFLICVESEAIALAYVTNKDDGSVREMQGDLVLGVFHAETGEEAIRAASEQMSLPVGMNWGEQVMPRYIRRYINESHNKNTFNI